MKNIYLASLIFIMMLQNTDAQNVNGNWTMKGPVLFPNNNSGQIHGIGRVSQIKFHPSNSQKVYAVSASGGLWISGDGGQSWNKTNTDNQIPQGSCSSVAIDYSNDNVIYLSTGDANYYYPEYGIYKSLDGGVNWIASNTGIGNAMAVEILISPSDHNTIIAATTSGVWKSTNAGGNWTKKVAGAFKSMVYKPNSANILYAATATQFYKSIDNGETWVVIPSVNPNPGKGGMIAVSEANPNIVYVGFVGSNTTTAGGVIYQSMDSGATFSLKKGDSAPNITGYAPNDPGQGGYNFNIFADRVNPSILYVCAHVVWKSIDGGSNWTQLTNWWEKCHTDMHQIISSPYDNAKLYNVNDGGIFISRDGGSNWNPASNGLSATEIYHMGQSKLSRNIVSIGTQDNGELYLNDNTWTCNRGGDWGSKASFDNANPSRVYYHGGAKRRVLIPNGGEMSFGITGTTSDNDDYVFSTLNTSLALVGQETTLKKTTNLLANLPTWTTIKTFGTTIKRVAISPTNDNEIYVVLTNNEVHYSSDGVNFNLISTTPTSPLDFCNILVNKANTNIVYLTCGDKAYRSINKGVNWVDISSGLPALANIISLVHDPYSTNESYYLATPFGVYYRNSSTSNWQSFSNGLPQIAQITDLFGYFDGTSNSIVRVSFYGRGVWESNLYSPLLANENFTFTAGDIKVYPNPSTDVLTIDISIPELINTKAQLFDLTGKLLKELVIEQPVMFINFANMSKGNYFIKFKNNTVKRIVIN